MKKAHILLVVRPAVGGMYRHLHVLINYLQNDFNFSVACPTEQINAYQNLPCRVIGLPLLSGLNLYYDYQSVKQLICMLQSDSIQFIHAHGFKAGFIARLAGRYCKVPCLVTVHSDFVQIENTRLPAVYLLTERFLANWTAEYITVSEWLASKLISMLKIKKERINVIPNGVGTTTKNPLPPLTLPFPEETVLVGTVARLAPQKGVETFIRAAAILLPHFPHARFVVAGSGPLLLTLRQLAKQLGLNEYLLFLGHCEQINSLLAKLTVFVLPSLSEAQGIAVLEAMAAGCPVVASSVGGLREIIQHKRNGLLVPPGDAKSLASAIQTLLLQPRLAARLAAQGKLDVARFSLAESMRKTKLVYERILGGRLEDR
ncbi:MAG: glycosyltransferase family 4 protein [Firmicutes bacterium]|nr:glycosyltransferase family 4 protein [Bacillota bacterium]